MYIYNNNIYNNIYTYVRNLDIPVGGSRRLECPSCKKRTFSVTHEAGTLLWQCFSASCSVKGSTKSHMSAETVRTMLRKDTNPDTPVFTLPDYLVPHTSDVAEWASELYGLDAEHLGLLYDVKEHRAVFPVLSDNNLVDATGRALGKRIPKWRRYGKSGLPYSFGCGSVAVVVEDCVSASVVGCCSTSFVGVALMGTSLQEAHKGFLAQFSTAVIALDPDALTKSFAMAKDLRSYVSDTRILKLNNDLKYRNPEDMEKLNGIITT